MFSRKKPLLIKTLIARGTSVQGDITFTDGLRIDGEVCGDVRADTEHSIVNLPIPHWKDLLNMASRCYELSGLGYVGVDFVLEPKQTAQAAPPPAPRIEQAAARPARRAPPPAPEEGLRRATAYDLTPVDATPLDSRPA